MEGGEKKEKFKSTFPLCHGLRVKVVFGGTGKEGTLKKGVPQ